MLFIARAPQTSILKPLEPTQSLNTTSAAEVVSLGSARLPSQEPGYWAARFAGQNVFGIPGFLPSTNTPQTSQASIFNQPNTSASSSAVWNSVRGLVSQNSSALTPEIYNMAKTDPATLLLQANPNLSDTVKKYLASFDKSRSNMSYSERAGIALGGSTIKDDLVAGLKTATNPTAYLAAMETVLGPNGLNSALSTANINTIRNVMQGIQYNPGATMAGNMNYPSFQQPSTTSKVLGAVGTGLQAFANMGNMFGNSNGGWFGNSNGGFWGNSNSGMNGQGGGFGGFIKNLFS